VVIFAIFNLMEAVLPSLVSKAARAGARGTAIGVFSSAQFLGAFVGGVLGGWVHQHGGPDGVYLLGAATALVWGTVLASMPIPEDLGRHVLSLDALPDADAAGLQRRLLGVTGVKEAVIALDEGVAYLKVDRRQLDWATLQTFSASS